MVKLTFIPMAFVTIGMASASHSRRILRPKDNVAAILKQNQEYSRGEKGKGRYTIHTLIQDGSGNAAGKELAMDVVEPSSPAVDHTTIIKDDRGNVLTVGNEIVLETLLVTDATTADGADSFAMLAINPQTDEMHGIVEKKGKNGERVPYKINQKTDENQGFATAQEEEVDFEAASDFHCDVAEHVINEDEETERKLRRGAHHHHHDHGDYHDQYGHHHHDNEHEDETLSAMESLRRSVRGIKVNPLNKPRRLQQAAYSFEVELFIEINNALVTKMGSLSNAINYVNAMVTGANVVYEKEIDTHLRVTNIKVSTLYDAATSSSDALNIMRTNYGGDTWHTANVDLHHGLFAGIGGGIAWIGVVCRGDYGFGLTSGLNGDFVSMNSGTIWDMKAFMHEIGHNFGSGHSHDTNYYNPQIDTCGTSCPTTTGYGWSTIMSYCQGCPGSYGNIMYTFGSDYDGTGDVNDLANWPANPALVANYDAAHQSVDPGRAAQKMYLHILGRAASGCLALSAPAPLLTPAPTPLPTTSDGVAFYDSALGVPKCSTVNSWCDSGSLLDSRAAIGGKPEANSAKNARFCNDGTSGSYHSDESVDNVRISTVGGGKLQPGSTVQVEAKVWAYSATDDFVDFYYATDATNPQWQLMKTLNPAKGASTVSAQFTLGSGSLQAVRVTIRYKGSAAPCPVGNYVDVDDLAFVVNTGPVSTNAPTPLPTTAKPTPLPTPAPQTAKPTPLPTPAPQTAQPTPLPTPAPQTANPTPLPTPAPQTANPTPLPTPAPQTANPTPLPTPPPVTTSSGTAIFDEALGAPKCSAVAPSCDSGSLLESRAAVKGMPEPNTPNTLDACTDGTLGNYHADESIDSVKVSTVGGGNIQVGSTVKIEARVWSYSTTYDNIDFYFATNAANPVWEYIMSAKPTAKGANTLSAQYTVGNGSTVQAVRVAIRYSGVASPCPVGSYDDVDDLAFVVG